ncbi:MAG TPA: hypothetical protein VNX28_10485 [Gemmataceae bacterium]|jgi:hypothetical protein|nr:hypothetical protein [Gemmataceae bacterium]
MASGNSFKVALRVYVWALGVTTFCVGSFLGIAVALSLVQGSPFLESENLFFTLVCALIAWLFVAVFLFGKETIHLPLNHPATFLANARRVLQELGYEVTNQSDDAVGTRRGFQLMFFGRGIQIQCLNRQARVTGPKLWVDALRRRLRVQNILSASDFSLHDSPQRGGVLLKRVQIQMRVSSEKLEGVGRHVLEILGQEAEVICEINLLAQSESGIRECTVEQDIRGWLAEQGITAEIHKDLVKMAEPPSTIITSKSGRYKLPV